jgi:site-specific recombinase XerD
MAKKHSGKGKRRVPKAVLRLPDLDQAKSAVLNSLSSIDAQRGYRHAIEEFVEWYCSEPRLSFSKTVVLRYRIHLESRHLAPGTINLRLGAVRRLAYEASDCGLLSPDLAAGIRHVKGVKKIGVRLGNWLTSEQSQRLWNTPDPQSLKGKRDRALLAVLLACGLRRHEAVSLDFADLQQREDHWAIVDLKGKAGHTRTGPMPGWVKATLDEWLQAAKLTAGRLFRRVNKSGKAWGDGLTEKAVWHVVREYARKASIERLAPHDLRSYAASRTMPHESVSAVLVALYATTDAAYSWSLATLVD